MSRRTWTVLVGSAVLVGLAVRVASVLARPHLPAGGDAFEYLGQANLLAAGKGWIEPVVYGHTGAVVQTAKLPPLYTLLLSLCSLAGFKSFFAHRMWSAVLSTGAVGLGAVVGRDLAGPRVGVVAAFGMALYPNMWIPAGIGMSETISPVMVLAVLWAAYRVWRTPTVGRMAVLGAVIGLAILARDELAVLAVLVIVPLAVGGRGRPGPTRRRLLGAGIGACVLVTAPWVAFNNLRFSRPVLITNSLGVTVAAANCQQSWHGPFAGYWWMPCAESALAGVHGDESVVDATAARRGLEYVSGHVAGLPAVEFDRLGRTFGFYRPAEQITLDVRIEGRPYLWAWAGLWCYYLLVLLAPVGAWALRRRGVPLFPMAAVLADVVLVTVITWGQTRYRATLEPVLVLLAATAVCAGVRRRSAAPGLGGQDAHAVPGGPVPAQQGGPAQGRLLHPFPEDPVSQ